MRTLCLQVDMVAALPEFLREIAAKERRMVDVGYINKCIKERKKLGLMPSTGKKVVYIAADHDQLVDQLVSLSRFVEIG